MNPYRTPTPPEKEPESVKAKVAKPFPHVHRIPQHLDIVRVLRRRDGSDKHVGRIGWVSIISPDGIYMVSFSRRSGSGCGFFYADEIEYRAQA